MLHALSTTTKAHGVRSKDYVASLLDWDSYDESFKAAIAPYLYQVIIETGREAIIDLGIAPSLYDPFAIAIREYQDKRTAKIATDVNDETEKQLRASLIEGLNAGEGTHQIRARIEQVFGFASTQRADLIASTEVARAMSYADIEAWGQSGVVSAKEWYRFRLIIDTPV